MYVSHWTQLYLSLLWKLYTCPKILLLYLDVHFTLNTVISISLMKTLYMPQKVTFLFRCTFYIEHSYIYRSHEYSIPAYKRLLLRLDLWFAVMFLLSAEIDDDCIGLYWACIVDKIFSFFYHKKCCIHVKYVIHRLRRTLPLDNALPF